MKKILFLFVAALLFTTTHAASLPASHPVKKVKATEVMIPVGNTGKTISLFDLSRIKVKEMEVLTGKKMKFFDRLAFKAAQKQLRSSINKDYTIDNRRLNKLAAKAPDGSGFHLGGFALGFLLGLIGVLIAYLINDDKKSTRVKWAWIGFAVWVVILIIAFVL